MSNGRTSNGRTSNEVGLEQLRRTLAPPDDGDELPAGPRAAVAAVFRPIADDLELLLIQRATHERDPWSGHMALPGGRVDPGDLSSRHTAERETREELGLDLATAERLGRLSDVDGGRATNSPLVVSAHCYGLTGGRPDLEPNHEVAEALWVPLRVLLDPARHVDHLYQRVGTRFPGIQLDAEHQVVWGLTLRFLADLFRRIDQPFII